MMIGAMILFNYRGTILQLTLQIVYDIINRFRNNTSCQQW